MTSRWLHTALVIGAACAALVATYVPTPISYNVTAISDAAEILLSNSGGGQWQLRDARIVQGYKVERKHFTGLFRPAAGARVSLERVSLGPLYLRIRSASGGSAGTLLTEGEESIEKCGAIVEITLANWRKNAETGHTFLIPIQGEVRLPAPIHIGATGSNAILRDGKIHLLSKVLLGPRMYEAGTFELYQGDQPVFDEPMTDAYGFVSVTDGASLFIAYRVVAKSVKVLRPGGQSYVITANIYDRLTKDVYLQTAWLTFAAILALRKKIAN